MSDAIKGQEQRHEKSLTPKCSQSRRLPPAARRSRVSQYRQGARGHHDALAEHLATEGYLPRVCSRLRQEGHRHDRRRSEDRSAARGRGGAGFRRARRGVEGHPRRRSWRALLPLRQEQRARALGIESRLWHGRQHDPGLAQVRWRQGAAQQDLQHPSAPTWSPSPMARCRPSRSAGTRSRSRNPTTSRA